MGKQIIAQTGRKTDCCLCRKILCRDGTGQADHSQQYKKSSHSQDIARILIFDAYIHDSCNNKRYKQFKTGFQHFKERGQHRLFFVGV